MSKLNHPEVQAAYKRLIEAGIVYRAAVKACAATAKSYTDANKAYSVACNHYADVCAAVSPATVHS